MKISLIRPSRVYFKESLQPDLAIQRMCMPLGLMYLSAYLKKGGVPNVRIIDCLVSQDTRIVREGDHIFHGIRDELLIEKLTKYEPDMIGISNNFTAQSSSAMRTLNKLKKAFPKAFLVLGGCHATVKARELMDNPDVDFVVLGEGEESFISLVNALEYNDDISEVGGIAYRKNGKTHLNQNWFINDLDHIPYPDYEAVDMEFYFKRRSFFKKQYEAANLENRLIKAGKKLLMRNRWIDSRDITVITSRGCPYNCVFCSIHLQFGKKFRAHSPEYVINHVKMLTEKYKVNVIHFEDDNISFKMKRFEKILDGLLENKIRVKYDFPNGMRGDRLNRNIIRKMIKTGCANVTVAVESGDQHILDNVINKSLKINDIERTLRICKEEGIPSSSFYMIGLPGETKSSIQRTVNLARSWEKKYGTYTHLAKAIPIPGTDLAKIVEENDYYAIEPSEENYNRMSGFKGVMIQTDQFSADDIRENYAKFYLRDNLPKYYFFSLVRAFRQLAKPSGI